MHVTTHQLTIPISGHHTIHLLLYQYYIIFGVLYNGLFDMLHGLSGILYNVLSGGSHYIMYQTIHDLLYQTTHYIIHQTTHLLDR